MEKKLPSERIFEMKKDSELRYALQDHDSKAIGTMLNMFSVIMEILDEQHNEIKKLLPPTA